MVTPMNQPNPDDLRTKFRPPYADLTTAADAREALIDLFTSLLPVAATDVADVYEFNGDYGQLVELMPERGSSAGRAQRLMARTLVDRLLTSPAELVIYPIVPADEVDEAEKLRRDSVTLNRMTYDLAAQLGMVIPPADVELDPSDVLAVALDRLQPVIAAVESISGTEIRGPRRVVDAPQA